MIRINFRANSSPTVEIARYVNKGMSSLLKDSVGKEEKLTVLFREPWDGGSCP